MQRLYGNPFDGYVGIDFAVRYWVKRYEHGLLDIGIINDVDTIEKVGKEKYKNFLCDLFEVNNLEDLFTEKGIIDNKE